MKKQVTVQYLLRLAQFFHIFVSNFKTGRKKGFCFEDAIAIDFGRMESDEECLEVLAEEIAHVLLGKDWLYPLGWCATTNPTLKWVIRFREEQAQQLAARILGKNYIYKVVVYDRLKRESKNLINRRCGLMNQKGFEYGSLSYYEEEKHKAEIAFRLIADAARRKISKQAEGLDKSSADSLVEIADGELVSLCVAVLEADESVRQRSNSYKTALAKAQKEAEINGEPF